MRNFLFVLIVLLLPASIAAAEPLRFPKDRAAFPERPVPSKRTFNSCAAYGAGFVKLDGTETCAKIGGAVSIGAGSPVGSR